MPVLTLCPKIDICWKIKIINDGALDNDLWAATVKAVCEKCREWAEIIEKGG